jgi:hypothetical protein
MDSKGTVLTHKFVMRGKGTFLLASPWRNEHDSVTSAQRNTMASDRLAIYVLEISFADEFSFGTKTIFTIFSFCKTPCLKRDMMSANMISTKKMIGSSSLTKDIFPTTKLDTIFSSFSNM